MRRFRFALFVALCMALAVQGVAQARALALPCGGHGDSGPVAVSASVDRTPATDHTQHARHAQVQPAASHDCCDDGDTTTPHTCKMGGDCQGHTAVPLLSAPASALPVAPAFSPVTRFAHVTVSPLRDRVWRPPAAA